MSRKWRRRIVYSVAALAAVALVAVAAAKYLQGSTMRDFTDGRLVAADYWSEKPEILSAGFGFDGIIGLPEITEDEVRAAGGSWYGGLTCKSGEKPGDAVLTSAAASSTIQYGYKGYADHDDGLPIVFSWPVATETVDPTDFRLTTNTGETVTPHAAGMNPNREDNEQNDEFALYGGGDFRLRTLTTGGFSPDGVTGLRPDM